MEAILVAEISSSKICFEVIIEEEELGLRLLQHLVTAECCAVTMIGDLGLTFNEHLSFERYINEKVHNTNSLYIS